MTTPFEPPGPRPSPRRIRLCGGTGGPPGREDDRGPDVLLVGISTRALADAALRSGFRPRTVDLFGDLDQRGRVENVALGRDLGLAWSADEAVRVAAGIEAPAAAYGADLENHPEAVARLSRGRELLGNPPQALQGAREPSHLFRALAGAGLPTPATVFPAAPGAGLPTRTTVFPAARGAASPAQTSGCWLVKPRHGGGGRGVALAEPGRQPGADEILQELVDGPVLSLAFLADGHDARALAISSEISRRADFGGPGFAYVGSLSSVPGDPDLGSVREQALRAATAATRAFGLVGWNGMDFVVRSGEVVPLELNPRHTSSMELWDGPGERLFAAHVEACRGRLWGGWLSLPDETRGKAILYARRTCVVGDSRFWPSCDAAAPDGGKPWPERAVADLPHPGELIEGGQPVCSLYATASSAAVCLEALRAMAARVEGDLVPATADPSRTRLRERASTFPS